MESRLRQIRIAKLSSPVWLVTEAFVTKWNQRIPKIRRWQFMWNASNRRSSAFKGVHVSEPYNRICKPAYSETVPDPGNMEGRGRKHRRKLLLGRWARAPPPTFWTMGLAYALSSPLFTQLFWHCSLPRRQEKIRPFIQTFKPLQQLG